VIELKPDEVRRLAGESNETAVERARYAEKLAVLQAGYHELKHLAKHRPNNSGKLPIRLNTRVKPYVYG
jgi:hypothetical protein